MAHLIQSHQLARNTGLGDLQDFCTAAAWEAERTGAWQGTTLELWVMLFGEHHRIRQSGIDPDEATKARLDALCRTLVARLKGLPRDV